MLTLYGVLCLIVSVVLQRISIWLFFSWSLFMWLPCKSVNSYCIFQISKISLIAVYLKNLKR